jgi:hypothetical protein
MDSCFDIALRYDVVVDLAARVLASSRKKTLGVRSRVRIMRRWDLIKY